jgi:pyruvate/2-oxoglutarate/acetoin dehydrogenase E1 component
VSKSSTKYTNKKEIKTLDEFTTPIVLIHSTAAQAGHLSAVHSVSPSKIFVSFGGFKNILPLVEKVLKSNLRDLSVNRTKPG